MDIDTFVSAGVKSPVLDGLGSTFGRLGFLPVFAFSGKMCAGKDTVGAEFVSRVPGLHWSHLSFAAPLKNEIEVVLSSVRSGWETDIILTEMNVDVDSGPARTVIGHCRSALRENAEVTAYTRTAHIRSALQLWGTDVRRSANPNYWVNKNLLAIAREVSLGRGVLVTDARFPNEMDAIVDIGGAAIRLEVGPEMQRRRLMDRDGIVPTVEALTHVSETALDNYQGFSLIVDTDVIDSVTGVTDVVCNVLSGKVSALGSLTKVGV